MIHVLWLSYYPNVPKRGYWDHGMQESVVKGCHHVYEMADIPAGEGAIVCFPAKAHEHDIPRLNADLAALPWVLLVLAEDECGDFNTDKLTHPNMRVWVQTPWLGRYARVDHPLPVGYRTDRPEPLKLAKDLDWFFCGQITHSRRQACARQLRNMEGGHLVETICFGATIEQGGLSYPDYLAAMARAKVIPCPSGNVTPDSFRLWEALEAGCVPIADGLSPRSDFPAGYWDVVAPGHPWPVVEDWSMLGFQMAQVLAEWDSLAARCGAWWLRFKRDLRVKLEDTLAELGAPLTERERVTILIPTSPIPDHPSTAHIVETVNSIRQYAELEHAEIIISCDGIRPEQEDLRPRYLEYIRDLLWLAHHEWTNVLVVVHEEHLHQVEMCRRALPLVRTEAILYVEHDTPLCDPIPWAGMVAALEELDVVRFYHETAIPHEHGYLHRGELVVDGHRFERTVQWSQRPHLARAAWYGEMLDANFSAEARTFVEDKMHSVAQSPRWNGAIGIYLPEGDSIRRSRHTDGRGGADKFDGGLIF